MIKLHNITKSFNGNIILNDLSIEITESDFLAIIGPSGCGKTTLLRVIAGLEKPEAGEVILNGKDLTELPPKSRNVAFVFQDFALYPHMTVWDNIAYPLKIKGIKRIEIDKKVNSIARKLRIDKLLQRNVKKLSGGEKQRVSIARALVKNPDLFLLDEPLSNADPKLRFELKALIKEVLAATKIPVIYVTHDQDEAFSLGSKIAILNDGIIHQLGTHQDIINQPEDLFVAEFIRKPPNNIFFFSNKDNGSMLHLYNEKNKKMEWQNSFFNENELYFSVSSNDVYCSIIDNTLTTDNNEIVLQGELLFSESFGNSHILYFKTEIGVLSMVSENVSISAKEKRNIYVPLRRAIKYDSITKKRITS